LIYEVDWPTWLAGNWETSTKLGEKLYSVKACLPVSESDCVCVCLFVCCLSKFKALSSQTDSLGGTLIKTYLFDKQTFWFSFCRFYKSKYESFAFKFTAN